MAIGITKIMVARRATGFVLVALAVGAASFQLSYRTHTAPSQFSGATAAGDGLVSELASCRAIGMAAKDDPTCEAAWAENRRRFFTYRPPPSAAAPQAPSAKER